jgi:crossover junction endodeoxyribonuclease RuvC
VVEGNALLFSECIETDTGAPFEERLRTVAAGLRAVIGEYRPDVLALETLFFSKNQKTAMRVAETRGAIILLAMEEGLSVREFSPGAVKIAITSQGNADKKQVMAMLPRLVRMPRVPKHDDEYDAIAVGITAAVTRA